MSTKKKDNDPFRIVPIKMRKSQIRRLRLFAAAKGFKSTSAYIKALIDRDLV